MEEYIFVCEDSMEGIFTAIYEAWDSKKQLQQCHIEIEGQNNYRLFCEYFYSRADSIKADKVLRTIKNRFGLDTYKMINEALLSDKPEKAQAVFKMVEIGIKCQYRSDIIHNLSNEYIRQVFELSRFVNREAGHLLEFFRFKELSNGVLFAKIVPKCNVLPIIAPHFTDRFPKENFIIYDEIHEQAAVHVMDRNWFLVNKDEMNMQRLTEFSKEEDEYQKLWVAFFNSISIKERENKKLQSQNMPKRFQKYCSEFDVKEQQINE